MPTEENLKRADEVIGSGDWGPGYEIVQHVKWEDEISDPIAPGGCTSYCPRCEIRTRIGSAIDEAVAEAVGSERKAFTLRMDECAERSNAPITIDAFKSAADWCRARGEAK